MEFAEHDVVGTRTRATHDTGVPLASASSAMTVNWPYVRGQDTKVLSASGSCERT